MKPWPATRPFADRAEAGDALAEALRRLPLAPPLQVLALPRGGVPVAAPVARALAAPLDLLLVRKIGAPMQPELAVAAVVEGTPPDVITNPDTAGLPGVDAAWIASQVPAALREIDRRRALYRGGRPLPALQGMTVVVVDDGIATGTTMRAALQALRRRGPSRLLVAVPVAPHETVAGLRDTVDQVVCLREPQPFHAIGLHYRDFHQVGDDEVRQALRDARAP